MRIVEQPVYWLSPVPKACQISGEPFNGVMYDANVAPYGWANVCQAVFDEFGCQLGTGRGQRYELQDDGRWMKTGG